MYGQCISSFWAGQPWFPSPTTVPTPFYLLVQERKDLSDEVDPTPPHLVSLLWLGAEEEEAGPVFAHQASSVGTLAMWMCPIYWWNREATSLVGGNALWGECWPSILFTSSGDCAGVSIPCCYPAGNKMNGRAWCAYRAYLLASLVPKFSSGFHTGCFAGFASLKLEFHTRVPCLKSSG